MDREEMKSRLEAQDHPWDLLVIGGGATGVGIAVDAAARGYDVLLLEQSDFGKGTSSRSTKLVHGGVRYLQQGNISLVMEALRERGILLKNAPHLVHELEFVVPNYDWWEPPFYGIGLKVYDLLAGKYGFGQSRLLSRDETLERLPNLETDGLRGGVLYHDGQFDDARLLIGMARTASRQGATLLNYARVTALTRRGDFVDGVVFQDLEEGTEHEVRARAVINATGPFADGIRRLDDEAAQPIIVPSQGVHIVLDGSFLAGKSAIMVPHTRDGRVLFAIPWHGRALLGTTDTPLKEPTLEPRALPEEIDFILETAVQYLERDPTESDVKSVFVGIRPLVGAVDGESTAALSRDHTVQISRSGLITIAGGKWTTYRHMAEDVVDQAATLADLEPRPAVTGQLPIHGYHRSAEKFGDLAIYGADAPALADLQRAAPELGQQLHSELTLTAAEVVWAARFEMARTVEDVLARRHRALFLDARAAIDTAPEVARLLAKELGRDASWEAEQVTAFRDVARAYLVGQADGELV